MKNKNKGTKSFICMPHINHPKREGLALPRKAKDNMIIRLIAFFQTNQFVHPVRAIFFLVFLCSQTSHSRDGSLG